MTSGRRRRRYRIPPPELCKSDGFLPDNLPLQKFKADGRAIEAFKDGKLIGSLDMWNRWRLLYNFLKDYKSGQFKWEDIMEKYDISRATLQKWRRLEVPDLVVQRLEKGEIEEKDVRWAKARQELDLTLDAITFAESEDYLNVKLMQMQRIIIKAFLGLKLTQEEEDIIKQLVKEKKCSWKGNKEYRELVVVGGMKGGKTTLGGVLVSVFEYQLFRDKDFRKRYNISPGEVVYIMNMATNADQAKTTVFAKTKGMVSKSPYYRKRKFDPPSADEYIFENDVHIKAGHSNSSSLVGKTAKAVFFDELARFTSTSGRSSAKQVYFSLIKSVDPFGMDGKIISISSPQSDEDMIMWLFKRSFGDPDMLGFKLATWEMNPSLPFDGPVMQSALRKSPEDFWRDNGAEPSKAVEKYYRDRDKIDQVFERGAKIKLENPLNEDGSFKDWFRAEAGIDYHLHLDPAVNNCAFGLAMTHRSPAGLIICDLVHRFKVETGEIDFKMVELFLSDLADRFPNIRTITFDHYMATQLNQMLKTKLGVEAVFLNVDKEIHDKLKIDAVYSGKLAVYPDKILRMEMRGLDLVNGKKVDHPSKNEEGETGGKDTVDALAGSVAATLRDEYCGHACGTKEEDDEIPREEMPLGGSLIW